MVFLLLHEQQLASFAVLARAIPCSAVVQPNVTGMQAGWFNLSPADKAINSNPASSKGVAQKPLISSDCG